MKSRQLTKLRAHDSGRFHFMLIITCEIWRAAQLTVLLFVLGSVIPTQALGDNHLAFVMGNDKYDHLPEYKWLTRSVKDAQDMSSELTRLHYDVTLGNNLSRATFNSKWQNFLEKIKSDDTVVIFLSGHGVEIEGHNFILPSDVPFIQYGRQEKLKRESLSVDELLVDLQRRKPRVAVLILDACRENPMVPPEYKGAAGPEGLARIDPPEGIFIMYSAGANETALDRLPGDDPVENSVYMRIFLPLMRVANLKLADLAQELRIKVWELTRSVKLVQRPAYYDGLIGRFCLVGCDDSANGPQTTIAIPNDPEKSWAWFRNTESEEALLAYIRTFPNTKYSKLAARRIDLIKRKNTVLHIVSVGISEYDGIGLTSQFSSEEARRFGEAVKTFMGPIYKEVRSYTLLDKNATVQNIVEALEKIHDDAKPDDTIVVYVSGYVIGTLEHSYLVVAADSRGSAPLAGLIDLRDLQGIFATMRGRRLLFLDLSTFGQLVNTVDAFVNVRADQITVLLPTLPGQTPLERAEFGGGLFNYALVEGLSGKAASDEAGDVSIDDLGRYVINMVRELSNGRQSPWFFTDEPNLILGSSKRDNR